MEYRSSKSVGAAWQAHAGDAKEPYPSIGSD